MSQKRINQTRHSGVQPPNGTALAGSAAVTRKSPGGIRNRRGCHATIASGRQTGGLTVTWRWHPGTGRRLGAKSRAEACCSVEADLRDTGTILTQAAGILDFTRPAAILLLAVLDHISDLDEARRIVARLLAAVPPGSFLVISHAASDIDPDETAEMISRLNEHLAEASFVGRPRDAVARFFDGLDLVGPGVVKVTQWHPRSELTASARTSLWGGMARKPGSSGRG